MRLLNIINRKPRLTWGIIKLLKRWKSTSVHDFRKMILHWKVIEAKSEEDLTSMPALSNSAQRPHRLSALKTLGRREGTRNDAEKVEGRVHRCISIQVPSSTMLSRLGLLTRVVTGLDKSMSAKLVSMLRQSRWCTPTRSRRCCRRPLVVAAVCIMTSLPKCRRIRLFVIDIVRYALIFTMFIYVTDAFESKLFRLRKPRILMTSSHCSINVCMIIYDDTCMIYRCQ